jgi:hypothetical protein
LVAAILDNRFGLFRISEANPGLIAGERDVDDRAHPELHAVMDQVLAASRQSPRERPNVSDSDHALTVALGEDNQAPLLSAQRNPTLHCACQRGMTVWIVTDEFGRQSSVD